MGIEECNFVLILDVLETMVTHYGLYTPSTYQMKIMEKSIFSNSYIAELHEIEKVINDLKMEQRRLISRRVFLIYKIRDSRVPKNIKQIRIADRALYTFLIKILEDQSQPLGIEDIGKYLKIEGGDLIPVQILNRKAYLLRRITEFCEAGFINVIQIDRQKLYTLSPTMTVFDII